MGVSPCPGESEWIKAINSSGLGMRNAVLGSPLPYPDFCLTNMMSTCGTRVTQTHTQVPSRQDRLAPDTRFYPKISERLKSNFFSLVPACRLSRPTILDPGPYQP